MSEPRVLPFGDDAVLVELADLGQVRRLDARVRAARATGSGAWQAVVDQVPAARSVLLRTARPADVGGLHGAIVSLLADEENRPDEVDHADGALVELVVTYDGQDLDDVATRTGLTCAEVVARHTAPTYTVAFGGFMPGFAYLVGLDPALRVPRLDSPRERVPAGSVAVADEFTAVYPAATPGGWRLLGRCDATLFDLHRDPPALLAPGTRVQFVPHDDTSPAR